MRVLAEAEGKIAAADGGEKKTLLQTIKYKDDIEELEKNGKQQKQGKSTEYGYDYEFSMIDGNEDFISSAELGLGLELESEEEDDDDEAEVEEEEEAEKINLYYAKNRAINPMKAIIMSPENAAAENTKMCNASIVQRIQAPPELVWSVVRRFDAPQVYKHFIRSCRMIDGSEEVHVGSIREVHVVSGLPASSSVERLDVLDDRRHVAGFSVIGGAHRLRNYRSTTSLHRIQPVTGVDAKSGSPGAVSGGGDTWTLVVESYSVDVPHGNTLEETATFVNTVIKCNLQSLAHLCERLASSSDISLNHHH